MATNVCLMDDLNENAINTKYLAYYYYMGTMNNKQDQVLLTNYSQLAN